MPTLKQREANLRNSQLSTGPITLEGKAKTSQNALRHGIFASDLTLLDDPESSADIQCKLTEYCDHFQPANPLERDLIEEIVLLELRKRRVARAETGLLNDARSRLMETDTFTDTDGTLFARYDTALCEPNRQRAVATMHLGAAWNQVAHTIDRMSRHEARLSGQIDKKRRLLADLLASRAREPEPVKNEPISDLTPIPATPIATPVGQVANLRADCQSAPATPITTIATPITPIANPITTISTPITPIATPITPIATPVGQVANLRADCQSAPVATPPAPPKDNQ